MSATARGLVLTLGVAMAVGGIALGLIAGGGWALAVIGGLIVLSVLAEGRYRKGQSPAAGARWQPTGEREVDTETGQPIEVWFDPVTGGRRYLPFGERPAE